MKQALRIATAIAENNYLDLSLLLQEGINLNDSFGQTLDLIPLNFAAGGTCEIEMLEFLIEHGSDPNKRDVEGRTPLYRATAARKADKMIVLMQAGADPNVVVNNETTLLEMAIGVMISDKPSISCITALLEFGANPNMTLSKGISPLNLALKKENAEAIELLLRYGADPMLEEDPQRIILKLKLYYNIDFKEQNNTIDTERSINM